MQYIMVIVITAIKLPWFIDNNNIITGKKRQITWDNRDREKELIYCIVNNQKNAKMQRKRVREKYYLEHDVNYLEWSL